jgi:hypothetical protein
VTERAQVTAAKVDKLAEIVADTLDTDRLARVLDPNREHTPADARALAEHFMRQRAAALEVAERGATIGEVARVEPPTERAAEQSERESGGSGGGA